MLKLCRIGGIVAESYGRIFYRNCIAVGLPAMICPGVSAVFKEGNTAEIDYGTGLVRNTGSGSELKGSILSPEVLTVLEKGGIVPLLKEMFAK